MGGVVPIGRKPEPNKARRGDGVCKVYRRRGRRILHLLHLQFDVFEIAFAVLISKQTDASTALIMVAPRWQLR